MKQLSSLLSFFGLLGSTIIASCAPVQAQSLAQTKLRVELVDVTSRRQQEFFGADEFFAQWVFSVMRNTTYTTRLSRAESGYGVTKPVSIKKGERKTFEAPVVVFEGVLPSTAVLSGTWIAMEEDENRKWDDASNQARTSSILASIEKFKHNRETSPSYHLFPITNEHMESWARSLWKEYGHSDPNMLFDYDDFISAWPMEITAEGSPQEELDWFASGDGADYLVHYRVTRTPVWAPRPTPAPTKPAPPVTPPVPTDPAPPTSPTPVPPPVTNPPTAPTPAPTTPPVKPAPTPAPVTPTVPTVPVPPTVPTTPRPEGSAGFLPLKYFEVRVDKVAPNLAGDKLEVLCTFKNRTPREENINGSMIQGVLTDADGVGVLFRDFYRLTGTPELVGGNQAIAPGGEFKTRLLVDIPEGVAPFKTMTFWETDSLPQTVDISNVAWPAVKPAANLGALKLKFGTGEFKACGPVLDVRFEGLRKARDGSYEAAFTFKNTSEETRFSSVLEITSSSLGVALHDANGVKEAHDGVMRPNGERALPMTHHVATLPGGETKIRYCFRPQNDIVPAKISVTHPGSSTTVDWSLTTPPL